MVSVDIVYREHVDVCLFRRELSFVDTVFVCLFSIQFLYNKTMSLEVDLSRRK